MKFNNYSVLLIALLISTNTLAKTVKVVGSMDLATQESSQPIVGKSEPLSDGAGLSESTSLPEYNPLSAVKGPNYRYLDDDTKQFPAYLNLKTTMSKRLLVLPDGKIRFTASNASLKDNINALLSHTNGGSAYFKEDFPENMRMYNEFYLYGDNTLDIVDQLIEPFTAKHNVHAYPHINNVIEFTFTRRD